MGRNRVRTRSLYVLLKGLAGTLQVDLRRFVGSNGGREDAQSQGLLGGVEPQELGQVVYLALCHLRRGGWSGGRTTLKAARVSKQE